MKNAMMDSTENQVELVLNNEGEDFIAVVPYSTAQILLNDSDAARTFIVQSTQDSEISVEAEHTRILDNCDVENEPKKMLVWVNKKPSQRDHNATKFFLELRQQYSSMFNDKKTIKGQIWKEISKKMNNAGYYVGEGRDAIEKCRIKFANLQKQYLNHIKHMKKTGECTKTEPTYFKEVHGILGYKDKVDPQNIQDSLEEEALEAESTQNEGTTDVGDTDSVDTEPQPSTSKGDPAKVRNRFTSKRSIKPLNTSSMISNLMKDMHTENSEARRSEFNTLKELLEVQNRQRDRFLDHFERLVNLQVKKRKRSDDSSDD